MDKSLKDKSLRKGQRQYMHVPFSEADIIEDRE
jgi:hypothetical protein